MHTSYPHRSKMTGRSLIWALVVVPLALSACRGGEAEETVQEDCLSNKEFFSQKVWKPVIEQRCFSCHNNSGEAKYSNFVLQPSSQTGYLDTNLEAFAKVARYEAEGKSIILQKPMGKLEHKGGPVLQADSPEIKAFEQMLERIENPVLCGDSKTLDKQFTEVELLSPEETLRKTTINLGGRLPTAEEVALIEEQGIDGMDQVIDNLAEEEVFYIRIKEMFNDMFLTDRYLRNDDAIGLLDGDLFPESRWYMDREENDLSNEDPAEVEGARQYANDSVAREPLELITYIVKNERPFKEVLTADYIVVNPFSARVYGIKDINFDDKLDPTEWKPGKISGMPHAGVMTSPMFLNRFPTTATNRNRHRSRMIYQFFLATDVMALAERPLDPTSISDFNPTMYNPQCTSCHAVIDPLAGAFQNWDDRGMYAPPENGWHEDMRPPGFGNDTISFDSRTESLPWLAKEITDDPRFATATVHNIYRGLMGHDIVNAVGDDPVRYDNLVIAHDIQAEYFEELSKSFIESDYNVKHLFKELVKGPYFRLKNLPESISEEKRIQYTDMGVGRLLTPEVLDRKIEAITGLPWSDGNNLSRRLLLRTDNYRILYGGMDSNDVTQRITSPNGIMANVQWRMANEMACRTTARDFVTEDKDARIYFKYVDPSFVPEDDNGFAVDGAIQSIKQNIQYLHWHILGERVSLDSKELERTYNLFYDTWKEGKQLMAEGELNRDLRCRATRDIITGEDYPEEQQIRYDETYAIRAWQAVITYMLSDYKFLYE